MSYDIGDTKKLRLTEIKDEAGAPVDPEVIMLTILRPSTAVEVHTLADATVHKEDLGSYSFELPLDEAGVWQYRWRTTGGVDLAEPGILVVASDPIVTGFADPTFTVADIWARSQYLQKHYPRGSAEAPLEFLVGTVAPLVGSMTGRIIAGTVGEAVPPSLHEMELMAIALKCDAFDAATGSAKSRRSSITRGNIASFSAGSYSESYFGPAQAMAAKKLDPDPVLADLLWALCTEEKQLYWLAIWEPESFNLGEGHLVAYEYGNRPSYSPPAGWGFGYGYRGGGC